MTNSQIQQQALENATNQNSESNYDAIFEGFAEKGISEEDKVRVFEPKFTTKSSGMGLGLPMVKNIVEAYNGTITFTSQINKGTVFKIMLPKK